MAQNYGLGKGLASLIPKKTNISSDGKEEIKNNPPVLFSAPHVNTVPAKQEVHEIEISQIIPNAHQPRFDFNAEKMAELAESIKHHGIIQPLVVSQKGEQFEIIA